MTSDVFGFENGQIVDHPAEWTAERMAHGFTRISRRGAPGHTVIVSRTGVIFTHFTQASDEIPAELVAEAQRRWGGAA